MTRAIAPYETSFQRDLQQLFQQFTLPRMEINSRENTGFWDTVDSKQFGSMLLRQIHRNLHFIVDQHFSHRKSELLEPIDEVIGNYVHGDECISITFYARNMSDPMGIKVEKEFTEGKKIATIQRKGEKPAYGEPDEEMFDWLYGAYIQGKTDIYNERNFALTLSIRNTDEYVDYSVDPNDYDNSIREWEDARPPDPSLIQRLIA